MNVIISPPSGNIGDLSPETIFPNMLGEEKI